MEKINKRQHYMLHPSGIKFEQKNTIDKIWTTTEIIESETI
jgi:hypothetical protein